MSVVVAAKSSPPTNVGGEGLPLAKLAGTFTARLLITTDGRLVLHVPADFVRGVSRLLAKPYTVPVGGPGYVLVASPRELQGKRPPQGQTATFRLGRLRSIPRPGGTSVWYYQIKSEDLQKLRTSLGLSPLPPWGEFRLPVATSVQTKQADFAPGIPDPAEYGDLAKLSPGQLMDLVIQLHRAQRAGEHYDVRFGLPELGLFSWATKKGPLPEPGQALALFQQPIHDYSYRTFEGVIPEGYGAGEVRKHLQGKLLLRSVKPWKVELVTAHSRHPERFVLLRPKPWLIRHWLLRNITPTDLPLPQKRHYLRRSWEEVEPTLEEILSQGGTVEPKIDGASAILYFGPKWLEIASFRRSRTTGRPILYTDRILPGKKIRVPKHLRGTIALGELFAEDPEGRAVEPQIISALLNSSLARTLEEQRKRKLRWRLALFDILKHGKRKLDWDIPRKERIELLRKLLEEVPELKEHLGADLVPSATSPEAVRRMLEVMKNVRTGRQGEKNEGKSRDTKKNERIADALEQIVRNLTREGLVVHPPKGKPIKVPLTEEYDVYIRKFFPGTGKHSGRVGGFYYSLTPDGPIVGKVGTGFSDELRSIMQENPEAFLGRVARVHAKGQYPSGALRAPALVALHEDYPSKET